MIITIPSFRSFSWFGKFVVHFNLQFVELTLLLLRSSMILFILVNFVSSRGPNPAGDQYVKSPRKSSHPSACQRFLQHCFLCS